MARVLRRLTAATVFVLAAAGCGDAPTDVVEPDASPGPNAAQVYLNAALDIMQANSINRYVVDWPVLRAGALTRIGAATTPAATYETIRWALTELGDNHSFFVPPGAQNGAPQPVPAGSAADNPEPVTQHLGDGIGYVLVPWFSGGGTETVQMAGLYHSRIEAVDTLGVCGWVVDLRGNTGGNMWPMIAGVGPILGEGTAGYFIDPDTVTLEWGYQDGASHMQGSDLVQVQSPYELAQPYPPVAVLTDDRTASSGEATTIAFRTRPDARSFGEGTFGVSTANQSYRLSDGATIYLTVSTMADRTKHMYGGVVEPDEPVGGSPSTVLTQDPVVSAGITWLLAQAACQAEGR